MVRVYVILKNANSDTLESDIAVAFANKKQPLIIHGGVGWDETNYIVLISYGS